jgi:hypothetical protein
MALAPIDLQSIFTQMDKVGKEQALAKDGAVLSQQIIGDNIRLRNLEKMETVVQLQDADEGPGKTNVQDENSSGQKQQDGGKKKRNSNYENTGSFVSDPNVGQNIDISL